MVKRRDFVPGNYTYIPKNRKKGSPFNLMATMKTLIDIGHRNIILKCDYCKKEKNHNISSLLWSNEKVDFSSKLKNVIAHIKCEKCNSFNQTIRKIY